MHLRLHRPPPNRSARQSLLSSVRPGERVTVLDVGTDHESALAREGIVAGREVEIETAAPLGGPLIVVVGGARIALGRSIARTIVVEPA